MRISVASIKLNRSLQSEPKEGTKLRELYDKFLDGSPVILRPQIKDRMDHRRMRELRENYSLDIRRIAQCTYALNRPS